MNGGDLMYCIQESGQIECRLWGKEDLDKLVKKGFECV